MQSEHATCRGYPVAVTHYPYRTLCAFCGCWIEPCENCHILAEHRIITQYDGDAADDERRRRDVYLHGWCMWEWIELREATSPEKLTEV